MNIIKPLALGRINRFEHGIIEASGLDVECGTICKIIHDYHQRSQSALLAKVIAFKNQRTFLLPLDFYDHIHPKSLLMPVSPSFEVVIGDYMLGHSFDGQGRCLDQPNIIPQGEKRSLEGTVINPLLRAPITEPLDVGIKSINSLLTIGCGQRIGLMAGSGVGKSVLLGMIAKFTKASKVVIGLIGERGREVTEFISHNLTPDMRKKAVIVAVPADRSPLERCQGALLATTIAEYYRDRGEHVLLMMDSLTRYAMAIREVSMAMGELPAAKGYSATVFKLIPQLVERAGYGENHKGSITGIYTVLAEGDDQQDPIVDAARAILDGHIVLSRELAQANHYPAIDISASISRCQSHILPKSLLSLSSSFRSLWSAYEAHIDLVKIGAYQFGNNQVIDRAIRLEQTMKNFLKQDTHDCVDLKTCFELLKKDIG